MGRMEKVWPLYRVLDIKDRVRSVNYGSLFFSVYL